MPAMARLAAHAGSIREWSEAADLGGEPPVWEEGQRNVYAWYYTAQTLHNLGGKAWETWFAQVQGLLLRHQAAGSGKTGGSWHPTKPKGAFLEWSEGPDALFHRHVRADPGNPIPARSSLRASD